MADDYQVDETRWPLVVVTFPPAFTAEKYGELHQKYAAMSRRPGARIGYLIDMRQFNPVMAPAAMRKAAADTFAANRAVLMKATVCEARVVTDAVTCGVLTAFDWLTGKKWPCANFTSVEEAERWIESQMRPTTRR
jgi:hypothetical protein